jgi:predicted NAD-dependent protein-ADP-ribosyltransferase YbiA (DUF1768 family)
VRADWAAVRVEAMLWVLELKLFFNRDTFGTALLSTGDRPIVEVSTKDDFWGCKRIGNELVGNNALGTLLVDVRARFKDVMRGSFTHPSGFLLD